ncbi:hypothetical protein HY29_10060 [Hyphomonas beringensis]|uniref:FAD-binding domain-containing protein n=1 Tax=Hyphomonas beringensis TaxID=1280946 RepID=A0A062UIH6_9PROT|nr:FAD-dependent monooxygenase [Hyphomonas beringensis]KCZ55940.1 hypothetical protein HY29_10060 [Hyphomonas beringensis]
MSLNIAISGAGIGGLAAAILLSRDGHSVSVYDQFDTPRPVGAGFILQETGLTILGEMGLRDRVEALGSRLTRLHGISADNQRTVLDVRYAALRNGLCGVSLQRCALFDLLYETALAEGVEIVSSARIITAIPTTGHLTIGTGQTVGPYDLLIDALGVRSPLSSRSRRPLTFGALWATLEWPDESLFDAAALEQRYRRARQMAGVMPSGQLTSDGKQTLTFFWSIRADAYLDWKKAPLDDWKKEATALWPDTEGLLAQITYHDQLTFARYDHRTHVPVVRERLVHIGDSWHAASPQLGQGANLALLDAYALARALRTHSDTGAALTAYVKMRRGHVRLFQAMSWMFTPVYQSESVVLAWLRDWLAAPLSRVPPAPQMLAGMVSGAIGRPLKKLGLKPGDQSCDSAFKR